MRFLARYLAALFMRATTTKPSRTVVDINAARRCDSLKASRKYAARAATYNPKQYRQNTRP